MRKFWLENEYGERLDLQSETLFFYAPGGLGFAENMNYEETRRGFFAQADGAYAQPAVSGTLVFNGPAPYEAYRQTADWLSAAQTLKLAYRPYGSREYDNYYMDVAVSSLEKGEAHAGVLEAPIALAGLTPWYSMTPLHVVIQPPVDSGAKQYGYRYEYRYSATAAPGVVTVAPLGGHFPAELTLEAPGPLLNPVLTVENAQTGEAYGRLDLSAVTIAEGETLLYSSRETDAGVWRQSADGGKESLSGLTELAAGLPTYFELPATVPLRIALATQNTLQADGLVTIYRYYKTR